MHDREMMIKYDTFLIPFSPDWQAVRRGNGTYAHPFVSPATEGRNCLKLVGAEGCTL